MKRLKLKVCGMREPGNIAAVAALTPDYLGLVFVEGSPRDATGIVTREVLAAIPEGVSTVGVFRDAALEVVCEVVETLGLQAVQLHGSEDERYIEELRKTLQKIQLFRALTVKSREDVAAVQDRPGLVDLFVLDSGSGGSGVPFEWSWLEEYRATTPFLLAGGIGLKNGAAALQAALKTERCIGIDVNSRLEEQAGLKDIELVRLFIERMRA